MKTCRDCKKLRPLADYYNKSNSRDGKTTYCQDCFKLRHRTYYNQNREKILLKTAQYEREHKEKILSYRKSNRESIRKKSKDYYWECPIRRKRINARRQNIKALTKYMPCSCCDKESLIAFYVSRPEGFQVDHIICAKLGGYHCLKNLQYLSELDHIEKGKEERKLFR